MKVVINERRKQLEAELKKLDSYSSEIMPELFPDRNPKATQEPSRSTAVVRSSAKEYMADDILNDHYEKNLKGKFAGSWMDKPIHLCTKEQLIAIIDMQGLREKQMREQYIHDLDVLCGN